MKAKLQVLLTFLLVVLGAGPSSAEQQRNAGPAAPFRVIADRVLPEGLRKAFDIRWAGTESLYIGLMQNGTVEVPAQALVGDGDIRWKTVIPGHLSPGGFWGSYRLGASDRFLAVAAPVRSLIWKSPRESAYREADSGFDAIEDIDVWQGRLVALAARRDEKGRFAPEGAVAWTGTLERGLDDLKPLLYDTAGPGAPSLNRCAGFGLGAARFLRSGNLLVVPGFQPGVHLYNREGKLLRSWDTGTLGLDTTCGKMTEEQSRPLILGYDARARWFNQRRILDDVLSLPEGAGLIVRSSSQGKVSWQLLTLKETGETRKQDLPVVARTERDRIQADMRGGRIAILVSAFKNDFVSAEPPRLVILESGR